MKAPIGISPLAWLDEVEQQRREAGLRRSLRPRPAVAAELDLASNDYLGLSQHPDVIEGGVAALRMWGAGATGRYVLFPNVAPSSSVQLTGDPLGPRPIPAVAGQVSLVAINFVFE